MKSLFTYFFVGVISSLTFAGISIQKIADLPTNMYETSGIELYKNKYLLTHNDSGNKPELFILDLKGVFLRKITLTNVKNIDWEDITIDDHGNVYIADIGNNTNERKAVFIYKIKAKDIESSVKETEVDIIQVKYEDQTEFPPKEDNLNYDAEAMFWKDDSLFILTKCRTVPFTGRSYVYGFPAKKGSYKVKPSGHIQFCDAGWRSCSLTAADYDPATNTIVALLYGKLCIIKDFKKNRFWEGDITTYNLGGIKQREGVCFGEKNTLYMTDEYRRPIGGGNLYKITLK
ncbi:MAG: SdiA-regulated domain-containing protein [Crocinitomicaceae bacterium]|nr:SdiA-regulated domain-containing protein [Crocinitomicaceae bacterium]